MTTTEVLPTFHLDTEMYEAARAEIDRANFFQTEFAPDAPDQHLTLSWEQFTDPQAWTLIPDETGSWYKAELTLLNTIPSTVRMNVWNAPDLRGGAKPAPHSHPWPFTSAILLGGYSETRYEQDGDVVHREVRTHDSGTGNFVPKHLFHEVTEIHDPGRTLSIMWCGQGERGTWGYLDVDNGAFYRTGPDPEFLRRLAALNPHQDWS